ncbi:MAG: hypothetical protein ACI9FR_000700 [Cryomorphaceae bacterium]|jgi:hypothetical protein
MTLTLLEGTAPVTAMVINKRCFVRPVKRLENHYSDNLSVGQTKTKWK